ncbi:cytochrome c3 family protein [Pseudomonadota bacterium]
MRMNNSSRILGAAIAAVLVGASGIGNAGIRDTKHNLSNDGNSPGSLHTDTTEICVFCHTPHMNVAKGNNIPLWNHQVTTSTVSYTMYTSDTLNASIAAMNGPGTPENATVTTLCLSCHDGTVAINALYNASNLTPTINCVGPAGWVADCKMPTTSNAALGTDLSNDHPVNFDYQGAIDNGDTTLNSVASLTGVRLYAGTVQCASCHDPHIDYNAATEQTPFLRVAITGSTLCLRCHNK